MAFPAKFLPFLVLITFFCVQIHARESQFFSKVTNPNNYNNGEFPKKQEQEQEPTFIPENQNKEEESLSKDEQEPTFIPETQNGYGLYGHESGQFPPTTTAAATTTTTTTTKPNYVSYTTATNIPQKTQYSQENYDNYPNNNNNNNYYYNRNAYQNEEQNMVGTRFTDRGYTTTTAAAATKQNNYYNGGNGYHVDQRQGMSDTRFLDNGRYYYDVQNENNYNPNRNGNSRGVDSRNEYNTNLGKNYYSNQNSYEQYNSNNSGEGYGQNEDEFQESAEVYEP